MESEYQPIDMKGNRKKVKIDESITVDEWKQHFMNLLEGKEKSREKDKGGRGRNRIN